VCVGGIISHLFASQQISQQKQNIIIAQK